MPGSNKEKLLEGFVERTDQRPLNWKLYFEESFMQMLIGTLFPKLLESLQLSVRPFYREHAGAECVSLCLGHWQPTVSEIPMCLKEERKDSGYHDLSQFLPGLAAGEESQMSIGGQWCLREKMQCGFPHQTKPLCCCTSSCFSSLPLLRQIFALLLLERLIFLCPDKGAIAGVPEVP